MENFKRKVPQILEDKHSDDLMFIKFKMMTKNNNVFRRECKECVYVYKNKCVIVFNKRDEQLLIMCDNSLGKDILLELENIKNWKETNKVEYNCQWINLD